MAHDLKLIYVPLFRFRVRTDGNKILTRYGAILDDIERTCRYWVADGGIVRFPAYHVQKRDKPGAYGETKGGISACYDNRDVYNCMTAYTHVHTRYVDLAGTMLDLGRNHSLCRFPCASSICMSTCGVLPLGRCSKP